MNSGLCPVVGGFSSYCAPLPSSSFSMCCPVGSKPFEDPILGTWSCAETERCFDGSDSLRCKFDYVNDFSSWFASRRDGSSSDWCLDLSDPSSPRACCPALTFGTDSFFDTLPGSVVVY
ncbi:hypothetical protein B9T07_25855 [Limnospira fusiformis CCALA 023]